MHRRSFSILALFLSLGFAPQATPTAAAHGITIKVQHPLAADAPFHTQFLLPWTQKVAKESGGRLHFHLQPDANPATLFDQAKAGNVDLVWAAVESAPGRFRALEAFELPFMTNSTEGASRALWEYVRLSDQAQIELSGLRPLAIHATPAPQLHLRGRPVRSATDLAGLRIAAGSRIARQFLAAAGAAPVELALPQMADALASAEVDGLLLPWGVLPAIKGSEALKLHADLGGTSPRLFSAVCVFAMNSATYKSLPDDLKKIVNANSGPETSAWLVSVLEESAANARKSALERGATIDVLPPEELAKWKAPSQSTIDAWIKELDQRAAAGKQMVDSAREALAEYDRAK